MEKEYYTCEFCQTRFIPKRRKVQKFCSPSCRSKNHHHKNKVVKGALAKVNPNQVLQEIEKFNTKKYSVDKMSISGVGNAAAGALAVEGAKTIVNAFKSDNNKPATKGDIEKIIKMMNQRYLPIVNMKPNVWNQKPFYDRKTQTLKYIGPKQENQSLHVI